MKKLSVLLILTALALSACEIRSSQTLKIGMVTYLRGAGDTISTSGTPSLNAARLAVKEANDAGGVLMNGQRQQVELLVETSANDPVEATQAVKNLIANGASAIVGPQYSGDAIAAGETAEQAKVPLITGTATNPQVTVNRRFVFRIPFTDDFQGRALADFAYNGLQARRIGVMYDPNDVYSSGLAQSFMDSVQQYNARVVQVETFESGNVNIEAQIGRLLATNPQLIFLPVYPSDAIVQAGLLVKGGYQGYLLGGDGWDSVTLAKLPAFNHSYSSTSYSVKITYPENRSFIEKYQAAYNLAPNDSAASVYDAFQLIFKAAQAAGNTEPQALQQALYDLPVYNGVTGPIDFIETGDPQKPVYILYYLDGDLYFFRALKP